MYEEFFGFRERPFDLTPNPRFLVPTESHIEALRNLEYGIASRKGVSLLLGDAGSGKTTIIRAALALQPARVHCSHLTNPTLSRAEFNETLAGAFGLSARALPSKTSMLLELEAVLVQHHLRGETTVLIVDEAQSMPAELLEEIRLLANIELDAKTLLSIVLAGQSELADRLNEPHLRQLKQRVALRCEIRPLTLQETREYIVGRIGVAGGPADPIFLDDALQLIHAAAQGVPRTINVIADNALLGAFAAGCHRVTADIVRTVCRDFCLSTDCEVDRRHAGRSPGPSIFETIPFVVPATTAAVPVSPHPEVARSAKRLVFRSAAGLAIAFAVVTLGAGFLGPEVTESVEPADIAEPIDAARTQPLVRPLAVSGPAAPDGTRPDPQAAGPPPAASVSSPANGSRSALPLAVARQVRTEVPAEVKVPEPVRTPGAGAVAVTRSGVPGAPLVSPTVTAERLSQASIAPGVLPSLAPFTTPASVPVALVSARAAGPALGPSPVSAVSPSEPPASAGPTPAARETAVIQSVLARYRRALETLSASGIESVWPTVNTRNLQRAFDQLTAQTIEFDACTINLRTTSQAAASCGGRASVVRKVGGGEPRFEARHWTFYLSRTDAEWIIDRVESR